MNVSTCPPPWIASPHSGLCYHVPDGRTTTHAGCADVCAAAAAPTGMSASLACLHSVEESRFLALSPITSSKALMPLPGQSNFLWLGHVQWPVFDGAAVGWTSWPNELTDPAFLQHQRWFAVTAFDGFVNEVMGYGQPPSQADEVPA